MHNEIPMDHKMPFGVKELSNCCRSATQIVASPLLAAVWRNWNKEHDVPNGNTGHLHYAVTVTDNSVQCSSVSPKVCDDRITFFLSLPPPPPPLPPAIPSISKFHHS